MVLTILNNKGKVLFQKSGKELFADEAVVDSYCKLPIKSVEVIIEEGKTLNDLDEAIEKKDGKGVVNELKVKLV